MKNTFTTYKGYTIETAPKQKLEAEMQDSIIYNPKGELVGGCCATKYGKFTSVEKAKRKIDSYLINK